MSQSAGLQDPDIYREKTPKPGDRFVQEFDFGKKPATPSAEPQTICVVMKGNYSSWDYHADALFTDRALADAYRIACRQRGCDAQVIELPLDDPKLLMVAKAHLARTKEGDTKR